MLSKYLALNNQDVAHFCPIYVNEYVGSLSNSLNDFRFKGSVFPFSGRAYRALNRLLTARSVSVWNPDVIHETYYSKSQIGPAAPRVVTVHDMIHEKYKENYKWLDPTAQEKEASVKRADQVICISRKTKEDLVDYYNVDESKISVVYHGVEPLSDCYIIPAARSKPYILYVGNRGYHKNFGVLAKAYASNNEINKNYDLVCFGGGVFSTSERNVFENLRLKVDHMSGGDEVLAGLFKGASLFVYPSLYEGFGLPPLESMSYGCPVLCSTSSCLPEIAGTGAMYFDPEDCDELAEKMNQILSSNLVKDELIALGYSRSRDFSWTKTAQHTLDVYKKAIDARMN